MKKKILFGSGLTCILILMAGMAGAVPITANFDEYPDFSPTRDNMDADESVWFNANDMLLDSFTSGRGKGSITLAGLDISYLTLTGKGGYTGTSTLIYDDGKGVPTDPVPEPASMFLLMSGLAGLAGFRKRLAR